MLLKGWLATLLLYALAVFLSGGGHSYAAMILFFPFVMIVGSVFSPPPWLFLPILFSQIPVYLTVSRILLKNYRPGVRLLILLLTHAAAVIISFGIAG